MIAAAWLYWRFVERLFLSRRISAKAVFLAAAASSTALVTAAAP